MDIEAIKQLATDVNNVAVASFQSGREHVERPLLAKIERLENKLKDIKATYKESVCAVNQFYYPKPVCTNLPPDISAHFNACLSCPMRPVCVILFEDNKNRTDVICRRTERIELMAKDNLKKGNDGQWHGCYNDSWRDIIVPEAFAHP